MRDGIDVNTPKEPSKTSSDPSSEAQVLSAEKDAIATSIAVATISTEAAGIAKVEGAQAIWGKNGRYFIIAG